MISVRQCSRHVFVIVFVIIFLVICPSSARNVITHTDILQGYLAHKFRISGSGFRVSDFGFQVSDFGFRVSGFGFRVSGFGFRVSGFGFWVTLSVVFGSGHGMLYLPPERRNHVDQSPYGRLASLSFATNTHTQTLSLSLPLSLSHSRMHAH